jgi:hypothetical protein
MQPFYSSRHSPTNSGIALTLTREDTCTLAPEVLWPSALPVTKGKLQMRNIPTWILHLGIGAGQVNEPSFLSRAYHCPLRSAVAIHYLQNWTCVPIWHRLLV